MTTDRESTLRKVWGTGAIARAVRLAIVLVALAITLRSIGNGWLRGPHSSLGAYSGFSDASYEGWVKRSIYVPVRDGTQLAADIFIPANDGVATSKRLPVLWVGERYQRARVEAGTVISLIDTAASVRKLVSNGYVVAAFDLRGAGASQGTNDGPFGKREAEDAFDVTEWLARQPWSNGKIGMFGVSYSATMQFMAAAEKPPHLKAIFPDRALFDLYDFVYPGGVARTPFVAAWSDSTFQRDTDGQAAPVAGARLSQEIVEQHRRNTTALQMLESARFRDDFSHVTGDVLFATRSPSSLVSALSSSSVAVYQLSGWQDIWVKDALLWHANLRGPRKLTIGPWPHTDTSGFSKVNEQLRWFDHWLKGVDNGVTSEAPIHYATTSIEPEHGGWRATASWPPTGVQTKQLWFCPQPSMRGPHAGLCEGRWPNQQLLDYAVDYAASSGRTSRWHNGYGAKYEYGDMRVNDRRVVTFTSAPLSSAMEVTGHPLVHIAVDAASPDAALVVFLEEVTEDGSSHYVSEGALRLSHRKLSTAPYGNLSLPFHSGFAADCSSLDGDPVEVTLDLLPISHLFAAGNRIRLAIAGADADNVDVPSHGAPTLLRIHFGGDWVARLELPVMPPHMIRPARAGDQLGEHLLLASKGSITMALAAVVCSLLGASALRLLHVRVRRKA